MPPVQHLGFSKALLLMKIPAEERQLFFEKEHTVAIGLDEYGDEFPIVKTIDSMSKRELQEAICNWNKSDSSTRPSHFIRKSKPKLISINNSDSVISPITVVPPSITSGSNEELILAIAYVEDMIKNLSDSSFDRSVHAEKLRKIAKILTKNLSPE